MRSVKLMAAASVASLLSTAALAADLPSIMPPPPPMQYAPPVEHFDGWYLRGDIGISSQGVQRLSNALDATLINQDQRLGFDSAGIFGLGVGYQFNTWLRADVTGEYRAKSTFTGVDLNSFVGGVGANNYHAHKSEWVALANVYADLGTWWCLTPFIGAGIGAANVTIANFTDQGITTNGGPSSAFANTASKWNFAYAAHAGVAYKAAPGLTVELAYHYLNMGDGVTGDIIRFDGVNALYNPMTFKNIDSHDVKLGVRWQCCDVPAPPPPLIRKG